MLLKGRLLRRGNVFELMKKSRRSLRSPCRQQVSREWYLQHKMLWWPLWFEQHGTHGPEPPSNLLARACVGSIACNILTRWVWGIPDHLIAKVVHSLFCRVYKERPVWWWLCIDVFVDSVQFQCHLRTGDVLVLWGTWEQMSRVRQIPGCRPSACESASMLNCPTRSEYDFCLVLVTFNILDYYDWETFHCQLDFN